VLVFAEKIGRNGTTNSSKTAMIAHFMPQQATGSGT